MTEFLIVYSLISIIYSWRKLSDAQKLYTQEGTNTDITSDSLLLILGGLTFVYTVSEYVLIVTNLITK